MNETKRMLMWLTQCTVQKPVICYSIKHNFVHIRFKIFPFQVNLENEKHKEPIQSREGQQNE